MIIDEIQRVPELLSTIQYRIDERKLKGQYLITGSRQMALKSSVVQSLAGRSRYSQEGCLSSMDRMALSLQGITLITLTHT